MKRPWLLLVSLSAVAALAPSLGCSSGAETVDCATATVKPFSELQAEFSACTKCHGSGRADSGYRYDNYEDAKQGAAEAADTIDSGSMPPGDDLTDAEASAIVTWAQCGTPE